MTQIIWNLLKISFVRNHLPKFFIILQGLNLVLLIEFSQSDSSDLKNKRNITQFYLKRKETITKKDLIDCINFYCSQDDPDEILFYTETISPGGDVRGGERGEDSEMKDAIQYTYRCNWGLSVVKLGTILAYDILTKTRDPYAFMSWMNVLILHYRTNAEACVWLLKYLTKHV
jgi:hypothetical protein